MKYFIVILFFFAGLTFADADSLQKSMDSTTLYSPIVIKNIDSIAALNELVRYIFKKSLEEQIKIHNMHEICYINNTLDSLKTGKPTCNCDGASPDKTIPGSFIAISQWKRLHQTRGRFLYRR
jgi:hypothetical protein